MARSRSKFGVSVTEAGKKKRQSVDLNTGETITFDSELEKRYYDEVIVKGVRDGSIVKYELQHKYELQPSFKYNGKLVRAITYISDFDVTYSNGDFVVYDLKGMQTEQAKIKRKLMEYKYPEIKFIWLSYTKATGFIEYDALQKIRRDKKKNND